MRQDLLALTEDDLATLSNRGILKRAQKELEAGEFTCDLTENDAGQITIRWSDPVDCVLPAQQTLQQGRCSCPATTLCRHLIRSVLAYQRQMTEGHPPIVEDQSPQPSASADLQRASSWDPGSLTDEQLTPIFGKTFSRLQQKFQEGHLLELVRSSKPTCRFHTLSCTVRFLVPNDPRYTYCDCAEPDPCSHVPLAVWGFRLLLPDQPSGMISTGTFTFAVPTDLLSAIEQDLAELIQSGIAAVSSVQKDRLRRREADCRAVGLVWPAEILAELVQEVERYTSHDARFSPSHVAELMGELCIRFDAIRHDTGAVPQAFIRGLPTDQIIKLGSARLIGLGCGVQIYRHGVALSAYLQDVDTGTVVLVSRDFVDPDPPEEAKAFWQLAQTPAAKGVSFAALASGQLLIQGGKRSVNGELVVGRSKASGNPQSFQWQSLHAPVLTEDFAELRHHLRALPPSCLRPRRRSENLRVCRIARVEGVTFNGAEQSIQAILVDPQDQEATLIHPHTCRSSQGTEALLAKLTTHPDQLCYVAGQVKLAAAGLIITPIALVFEQGKTRSLLQPWIERWDGSAHLPDSAAGPLAPSPPPAHYYPGLVLEALGELLLLGLHRIDVQGIRHWQELHRQGSALGFSRFLDPIWRLLSALEAKSKSITWEGRGAAEAALTVMVFVRLAQEELQE